MFQSYLLRPLDTLFFRGGQPFNAGDDHFVQSQFPPTPRTLQGIVRTKLLQENGVNLRDSAAIQKLVGNGDDLPSDLKIRGPFPAVKGDPCFPAPRYLTTSRGGDWRYLQPHENLLSDIALPLPALPSADRLSRLDGWLSWEMMKLVLWGNGAPSHEGWRNTDLLWDEEVRTGIARDKARKTARQQHLYTVGHIRLKADVTLWFQSTRTLKPELMPVGGEGRIASFERAREPDFSLPDDAAQDICKSGQFWLILVQPAKFDEGWKPDFTPEDLKGIKVRLITAVVGKPQPAGGFNMVGKRPRDLFRYVPAGSAYLVKLDGNRSPNISASLQQIHNSCALGDQKERQMGFGHIMVGKFFNNK